MKKDASVIAAEKARDEKAAELVAAEKEVKRIQEEYRKAINDVRKAQEAVDSILPQCRLVHVRWRSGTEDDAGRVVIEKKTPSGILVVRKVGDTSGTTYRFKKSYGGSFDQAEKRDHFSGHRSLRDVPAEYLTDSSAA